MSANINFSKLLPLDWQLGHAPTEHEAPTRWVPAKVPGAVQLDWAHAEGWPPYWKGEESNRYGWMEDVFWNYSARADVPPLSPGERLFLRIEGADHHAEILLGDMVVATVTGREHVLDLDVTGRLHDGDMLTLRVHPAPKMPGAEPGRREATYTTKAAVSYGWDWHPRLIPLGLPGAVTLEVVRGPRWLSCDTTYTLSPDLRRAEARTVVHVSGGAAGTRVAWTLTAPGGTALATEGVLDDVGAADLRLSVDDPLLWWPHDQGVPHRYLSEVGLLDGSGKPALFQARRIGFRRVELVMHPAGWETRESFPKSRNEPPITLRVNGRPVFGKGSNWIPPEIFPCNETPTRLVGLVRLAKEANFNLLRCWGGAAMPRDAFFDACDELGIMAWVEFPLGCNPYPDDPGYLAELDTHARDLVRRVRPHPCLALWCGGNELFNRWSLMTDQALPLRLLNSVCLELDPWTPFIPTSPLEGIGHGNYLFRYDDGREVYEAMRQASNTAYTEFGMPGPSAVETLRSFIPADELFPPSPRGSWKHHHGFGAWVADTWLCWDLLQDYFGAIGDLETLVRLGQWMQSEGYKAIYEEARRQKPVCSMALNWCFNECWPCAANNSLLEWPARKKPAFDAVAASCRLVLASLGLRKFSWTPGEAFECDLWLLNDAPEERPAVAVEVWIHAEGADPVLAGSWNAPAAQAGENMAGPTLRFRLPRSLPGGSFRVNATVSGRPDWSSSYRLHNRGAAAETTPTPSLQLNA